MFDSLRIIHHQSSGSRFCSYRDNRDYYGSSYRPSGDRGYQEKDNRDN